MNEKVFLFPLFAAFLTAAMEVTELKEESILTMVKRQERVIGELLGEIEGMKVIQKHDREDIKRNGQEIANLKKENEELKAVIEANSKGHDMPDRNLAIVPDVIEIEMDKNSEIIRKAFSKRSFTTAPTPTPTSPKKAAFSAKLSPYNHNIGNFGTVIFENIMTNIGGHYSGEPASSLHPKMELISSLPPYFPARVGILRRT
ncbi:uncharacterized protein LOC123563072 [Mercenaria mercenaria]|uniref:uncharacterized protein LOC123563072 n=1 Tax=Mercenaria mercenaria TaxID=6596 RepID=UPI00234F5BB5|nr:uncharacterized protein LOC123563072 [Mercenaria mercenaria]